MQQSLQRGPGLASWRNRTLGTNCVSPRVAPCPFRRPATMAADCEMGRHDQAQMPSARFSRAFWRRRPGDDRGVAISGELRMSFNQNAAGLSRRRLRTALLHAGPGHHDANLGLLRETPGPPTTWPARHGLRPEHLARRRRRARSRCRRGCIAEPTSSAGRNLAAASHGRRPSRDCSILSMAVSSNRLPPSCRGIVTTGR